jgi:hypothetical protein
MTACVTDSSRRRHPTDGATRLCVIAVLISLVVLHLLATGCGNGAHTMAEARPRPTHRRTSSSSPFKRPRDGGSAEDAARNGLREKRCAVERDFEACYMCGKIVDNKNIYVGCCSGERAVLEFCDQLLF